VKDTDVDGRVLLKNSRFKKEFSGQEQGQTFGFCEHGGVGSGFEN
jgi:hypothetical protein